MKKFIVDVSAITAISLLFLFGIGCQQDSSDVVVDNKALIRQVFSAIDAQNYDQLRQLLSKDFVLQYVGQPEPFSLEATFDLVRGFYSAFPDYTHVIEEMVAEGDLVAVKLTYHATHKGEFEGIPPTEKRISYAGAQIIKIVNGVVTEWWALEDNLGLMMQLGMQLSPAEPGF